ncbi:PrsW family intramembrane metalloprotease [Pseudonocardia alaniniphila]|uniref:PrsW family intramembrane metalloprotease n=1 Tax=Pseudonocardia alaniniphila TaxID=75291 RepID=A0ABS9TTF3_9PSEU|nr:PrsW family intramembrane metalloprotease [Pseudonocardia alaniniphila]MCH6171776.1 PrsW family intramembrane metalloprotease [Pseudonocardia alaniniphila]
MQRSAWTLWPVAAGAAWLISMFWVSTQVGPDGVAGGLLLSALITLPVVGAFLWLDRWEPERPHRLVSAFVWGASFAAFCSLWSQQGLQAVVDITLGTDFGAWFRPLVITPVTEEVFKGLFLVWLLVYRRKQITGPLVAIVYAGLVGAGFSFTENVLYLGRTVTTFATSDVSDVNAIALLAASFFLRMVMVPFFHPLMVAVFGLGIAAAAHKRSRAARVGLALVGLLVAITLHGVWDWAGLAGSDPFLIYKIYAAVMVPVFLVVLVLALVLRSREGTMISAALPALARDGHIAPDEVTPLANLGKRRRWRRDVRRRCGRAAARATGRYQAEASALGIRTARARTTGTSDGLDEQVQATAAARADMLDVLAAPRS